MTITALAFGGTGFPNGGDGVTESFLDHLDASRFVTSFVRYPASGFGIGAAYADSVATGMEAGRKAVRTSGDRVLLVGYSQGAVVAGDLAAELARTGLAEKIAGVALIADGRRPAGPHTGTPGHHAAPGYGIIDERPIPTDRFPAFWASAPGDPICSLPEGNPLRTVADIVGYMSISRPEDITRWGARLLDLALKRGYQRWWNLKYWQDWDEAGDFARGFLFSGRHTDDYVRYGHTRALAETINGQDWQ